MQATVVKPKRGRADLTIDELPPAAYSVEITGLAPSASVAPVSSDILVWG